VIGRGAKIGEAGDARLETPQRRDGFVSDVWLPLRDSEGRIGREFSLTRGLEDGLISGTRPVVERRRTVSRWESKARHSNGRRAGSQVRVVTSGTDKETVSTCPSRLVSIEGRLAAQRRRRTWNTMVVTHETERRRVTNTWRRTHTGEAR